MSRLRVRADAHEAVQTLADLGVPAATLNQAAADDGWISRDSLDRWAGVVLDDLADKNVELPSCLDGLSPVSQVASLAYSAQRHTAAKRRTVAPAPVPTMTVEAAFASGRITATSRPQWEARYNADPAGIGAALASLAPTVDNTGGGRAQTSDTPLLDAFERQFWGPTAAQAKHEERLRAEAEFQQQIRDEEAARLRDADLSRAENEHRAAQERYQRRREQLLDDHASTRGLYPPTNEED